MEKNNNIMKGSGENGKWITVNGAHIFVEDGQSVEDAMNKKFGKPKPRNADGSFNIPSIHESLKRDYENGELTLEQVAEEYFKAGHTTYVNVDYAKKQLGITDELNQEKARDDKYTDGNPDNIVKASTKDSVSKDLKDYKGSGKVDLVLSGGRWAQIIPQKDGTYLCRTHNGKKYVQSSEDAKSEILNLI